jgi:hypothetical protein
MIHAGKPALFMTVRREITRKRVPREAHFLISLVTKLTSSLRPALHAQERRIREWSKKVH